jgi:uncharacterized protein
MRNLRWLGITCLPLILVFGFGFAADSSGYSLLGALGVAVAAIVCWRATGPGKEGLARLGFTRPPSWAKTVLWAIATAIVGQLGVSLASPLVLHFWRPPDFSALGAIKGHPWALAKWLVIIWTTAAFGEETIFRGFLIPRMADIVGNTRWAQAWAIVISATLFGIAHSYQGPSGSVLAGVVALVYGTSFIHARRNLWRTVLAHGLYDSSAFILLYFMA